MLVKLTPAELMTTDVMRMTLEIGAGVDVITSTFSFLDGLFVEDGAAVSDVGEAEGDEAVSATLAEGQIRIRIFYTGWFRSWGTCGWIPSGCGDNGFTWLRACGCCRTALSGRRSLRAIRTNRGYNSPIWQREEVVGGLATSNLRTIRITTVVPFTAF